MIAMLFIIILLFLPIPIRINVTLNGLRISDSVTDDNVNISVKGWDLIYLFRPNEIKGTLTITPYALEKSNNLILKNH